MLRLKKPAGRWRRAAAERKRREAQARRAKVYVVRDGRGRVVSSH
jgi:hypothetical protein